MEEADLAEQALGKKWFWPILKEIEAFEEESCEAIEPLPGIKDDEAPDWAFEAFLSYLMGESEDNGLTLAKKQDARSFGTMVGFKAALCELFAAAHLGWSQLTSKQSAEIDNAWWPGFSEECKDMCQIFAEKLKPRFQQIKTSASALASKVGGTEEIDYMQGYVRGVKYAQTLPQKLRPARHKREEDRRKRACVVFFALCAGREIDQMKADLSWPELHQLFEGSMASLPGNLGEHPVTIEEDAFIQHLKRAGLKGVGKPGRRPSNEMETPQI